MKTFIAWLACLLPLALTLLGISFQPVENILNFVFPIMSLFVIAVVIYSGSKLEEDVAAKTDVEVKEWFDNSKKRGNFMKILFISGNILTIIIMASARWYWFAPMWSVAFFFVVGYGMNYNKEMKKRRDGESSTEHVDSHEGRKIVL